MRTRITNDHGYDHRCTLAYNDEYSGERIERQFFAAGSGRRYRYVHEDWLNPKQVCNGLASTGPTLVWDSETEPLVTLIRRERRRALRFWRTIP